MTNYDFYFTKTQQKIQKILLKIKWNNIFFYKKYQQNLY